MKKKIIISLSIVLGLIVILSIAFFTFNDGVVTKISFNEKQDGAALINISYLLGSGGYSAHVVSASQGEYTGDGKKDYDGSLGDYRILIEFGDISLSNNLKNKIDKNGTIDGIPAKIAYPSDHGFALYLGFDKPIELETQDGVWLNSLCGTIKINITYKNNSAVSSLLQDSARFTFSSGAGGWRTILNLAADGTFTGEYTDSEMGARNEEHPNGTQYICSFSGKFDNFQKANEYSYKMTLAYLKTKEEPGKEYIEDGVKYITNEPYGLEEGKDFILYLPNTPIENLSEEFLSWCPYRTGENSRETLSCYGIFNVNKGYGFFYEELEINAEQVYKKFLNGEITVLENDRNIDIEYLKKNSDGALKYGLFDCNGDNVPELCFDAGRYIITFWVENGELKIWREENYYSVLLSNGNFLEIHMGGAPNHTDYTYYVCDYKGKPVSSITYSVLTKNDEVKENRYFQYTLIYNGTLNYKVDEIEITKEVFDNGVQQIEKIGEANIDWKTVE